MRLPIAALLSSILAFRPRRRGTPERQSTVVQTQIILAIADDIAFEVKVPLKRHTDQLSTAIVSLDPKQAIEVKWDKKKDKP